MKNIFSYLRFNMKTLELKDVVGYLPYNLNFINTSGSEEDDTIYTLRGLSNYYGAEFELPLGHCSCVNIKHIKPILRSMSDLNKPITIKGYNNNKKFNPTLELAKLCIPSKTWYVDDRTKKIQYKDIPYYCHSSKTDRIYFKFYKAAFIRFDEKGILDEVASPFKVVDLLYQWHFDVHNLIDKGLALDINKINKD